MKNRFKKICSHVAIVSSGAWRWRGPLHVEGGGGRSPPCIGVGWWNFFPSEGHGGGGLLPSVRKVKSPV